MQGICSVLTFPWSFGMSTRRLGWGLYPPVSRSSFISARKHSSPAVSMSQMFDRRSRPHHHSSWLYGRPPQGSPSVSHGRRCPRSDVPFPTSPSDISAVAAPATRWVPLSSHPLPRFDKRSSSSVRALPSGRVLLHAHQQYRLTRSDSLTLTLPFPTHGYRECLFGGISPAGRRGSLQLTRCRSHHVAADTPPVRTAASDLFHRPLLPSRVIDRLGHRLIV